MKKLLIAVGVMVATFAQAQGPLSQFRSYSLLNVVSLTVTNARGYTNTATYFSQLTPSTNTTGIVYTNQAGTQTLVGTNDTTTLFKDIPFDLDANGNIRTNIVLTYAASFGSTTTGNVEMVLAPILKGPLQPSSEPMVRPGTTNTFYIDGVTFLNISNTINVNIPVTAGGAASASINISLLGLPATSLSRGLRLVSLCPSNVTGSITLYDLSRSAYIP